MSDGAPTMSSAEYRRLRTTASIEPVALIGNGAVVAGAGDTAIPPQLLAARFRRSTDVPSAFFLDHAALIARACLAMARRFEGGGRLLVLASDAEASDAHHVAVEFVHPVLVGKRALPALALTDGDDALAQLARANDVVMALGWTGLSEATAAALARARGCGMLALALTGRTPPPDASADFAFHVPDMDPLVVQETHETLYHVLWELVHLFLERRLSG